MNINPVNSYNQNFQAKIKMSSAKTDVLKKVATVAAGASMVGVAAESLISVGAAESLTTVGMAPGALNSMVESLPDGLVESQKGVLTSAAENGWPVQSTMAPATLSTVGSGFLNDGLTGDDSPKIFFS